jgi:cytosine/adenosine deaminase-related metal-dependent hydrolase
MSYKLYTHELLIKNPQEILKNRAPRVNSSGKIEDFSESITSDKPQALPKILIPGLINLHTHLAYTNLKVGEKKLFYWLKDLVEKIYKIPQIEDEKTSNINEFKLSESYLAGCRESLALGTTFVVDNTSHPELALSAFLETGLQGIIGLEVFGSDPDKAQEIFGETLKKLHTLETQSGSELVEFTLAPHATYDVSSELWSLCVDYAKQYKKIILSHLSESADEEAWFRDKDSAESLLAREFWASINTLEPKIKNWKPYRSATDFLATNKLLAENLLLAHACYIDNDDLDLLTHSKTRLVTCPRSNGYLKNQKARTELWQKNNLLFGVGTDSKASNYSLDLRQEANQLTELSARARFELITSRSAQVLDKQNLIGTLEPGKNADWVILEVLDSDINLDLADPFELVMDTKITRVKEVHIAGKPRYQAE